jgi:hypothetical protein
VRRILMVLTVALVMAAMVLAMAMPVFAAPVDLTPNENANNQALFNSCESQHPQGNYCENKYPTS